jgi:hypothetical protein
MCENILQFPREILREIQLQLDPKSFLHLQTLCKRWYTTCTLEDIDSVKEKLPVFRHRRMMREEHGIEPYIVTAHSLKNTLFIGPSYPDKRKIINDVVRKLIKHQHTVTWYSRIESHMRYPSQDLLSSSQLEIVKYDNATQVLDHVEQSSKRATVETNKNRHYFVITDEVDDHVVTGLRMCGLLAASTYSKCFFLIETMEYPSPVKDLIDTVFYCAIRHSFKTWKRLISDYSKARGSTIYNKENFFVVNKLDIGWYRVFDREQ